MLTIVALAWLRLAAAPGLTSNLSRCVTGSTVVLPTCTGRSYPAFPCPCQRLSKVPGRRWSHRLPVQHLRCRRLLQTRC